MALQGMAMSGNDINKKSLQGALQAHAQPINIHKINVLMSIANRFVGLLETLLQRALTPCRLAL